MYLVADPGFPRGGGANSPGGHQHTNLPHFPQKLHEIERIWTPRGAARPSLPSLDLPLVSYRYNSRYLRDILNSLYTLQMSKFLQDKVI